MRSNVIVDGFTLAGYDVEALLGFGGSGEVWCARELATGERVALKRLHRNADSGTDGAHDQRLHREAALLASVRHEHVVRLRSVVQSADGLVLVLDYAAGGSLASVLAARGRLTPGEIVTVGAPLAQALGDAHSRGLTHGDVTPANIVFDESGKPLLADLGVARLVGELANTVGITKGFTDPAVLAGGRPTPASDIYGLAAVCFVALTGAVPGSGAEIRGHGAAPALVVALESALDPDPRARPDGMAFARALYGSCSAEPVRLVRGAAGGAPRVEPTHHAPVASAGPSLAAPVGRHRGRRFDTRAVTRRLALPFAAVLLLATAVITGIGWASHDRSAAASAGPVSPTPAGSVEGSADGSADGSPSWQRVLAALDRLRDDAFTNLDPDELESVYDATSPALQLDRSTLADLAAAHEHARGLALRLTSVQVRSEAATRVELVVRDVLSGYDLVGADGRATHQAGRGEQSWVVTLVRASAEQPWRIGTIDRG
jgi:hypothetical protein